MISLEKKYRTRDGREVRLIALNGPSEHPVVGVVDDDVLTWDSMGFFFYKWEQSGFDLVVADERYVVGEILQGSWEVYDTKKGRGLGAFGKEKIARKVARLLNEEEGR